MDWVGVVPEVRTYPRQQLSEGGECSIFFLSFRATQKRNAQRQQEKKIQEPIHGCLVPGTSGAWDDPGKSMLAVRRVEQAREQAPGGRVLGHYRASRRHWTCCSECCSSGSTALEPGRGDGQTQNAGLVAHYFWYLLPGSQKSFCRRFLREAVAGLNLNADGDEWKRPFVNGC